MKLGRCTVANFGSYSNLQFDFQNLGLTLVQGPTGSGKSSLFDAASWILFGVTAKNGSVDEVRSWKAVDSPTAGTIQVDNIEVTRVRGRQSDNDLYWVENGVKHRGKDLKDTQAKLEARLGVTAELYLAASYFNEFSLIASFFMATAKNRRTLLDLIADTTLADKLTKSTAIATKNNKIQLQVIEKEILRGETEIRSLVPQLQRVERQQFTWDEEKKAALDKYTIERDGFEKIKQSKIEAAETAHKAWEDSKAKKLSLLKEKFLKTAEKLEKAEDTKCPTCGMGKGTFKHLLEEQFESLEKEINMLVDSVNPQQERIEDAKALVNNYQELLDKRSAEKNPHISCTGKLEEEITALAHALETIQEQETYLKSRHSLIEELNDIATTLRGELVKKAINEVQDQTNAYLERFFESEIRVTLSVPDNDSVEVEIRKNGYECVYSQLSKGQRGLLKLCFSLSVMASAANKSGIHFENIYLDEALDGLDSDLKVKAFNLLSELSTKHSTVMVIDHSNEFKACFPRQYSVELNNDESEIYES